MIKPLTALALCVGATGAATALFADIQLPARSSDAAAAQRVADSTLRARPAPSPMRYGLLWLEVEPGDAQVSLDGAFLDSSVWLISMAPGRHAVSIRKDGFRPIDRSIGIGAGENLRLAVQLEKDSVSQPGAPVATVPGRIFPPFVPASAR